MPRCCPSSLCPCEGIGGPRGMIQGPSGSPCVRCAQWSRFLFTLCLPVPYTYAFNNVLSSFSVLPTFSVTPPLA